MKILRNSILITMLFVCLLTTSAIYLSTQTEENFKSKKENNSIIYDTPKTSGPNDWTILIYLDGDNNLESEAIDDFEEMASIGEDENINILVQFDRALDDDPYYGYSSDYGNWQDTMIFNITKNLEPWEGNEEVDLDEVDMNDPTSLSNFITWGFNNAPTSAHYALILWDHGGGWEGLCSDEENGGLLDLLELKDALSTANRHFDLIAFDACLMGMTEVFCQIRDWCDFCIASEESIPGDGFPYNTILSDLKISPTMSAKQLGDVIVNRYIQSYSSSYWQDETISLVNMSKMDDLASAIDELSNALINGANKYRCDIQLARELSQIYSYEYDIDLYDFADGLYNYVFNNTIKIASQNVMSNITSMVLSEAHNDAVPDSYGMSIFFPYELSDYNLLKSDYINLNISQDHLWDEFLDVYHSTSIVDDNYEQNDDFSDAYNLTAYEGVWLSSINGSGYMLDISGEYDFYLIEISTGINALIVDVQYSSNYGDIDVYIHDSNYDEIAYGISGDDNEYIDCMVSPGIYYIRIYLYDGGNNTYNIRWDQYYKILTSDGDDDDDDDDNEFDWTSIPGFNVEFLMSFIFVSILSISIILLKRLKYQKKDF